MVLVISSIQTVCWEMLLFLLSVLLCEGVAFCRSGTDCSPLTGYWPRTARWRKPISCSETLLWPIRSRWKLSLTSQVPHSSFTYFIPYVIHVALTFIFNRRVRGSQQWHLPRKTTQEERRGAGHQHQWWVGWQQEIQQGAVLLNITMQACIL